MTIKFDELNILGRPTPDEQAQARIAEYVDMLMQLLQPVNELYIQKIAEQIKTIEGLNASSINRLSIMAEMNANIAEIKAALRKALGAMGQHLEQLLLKSFEEVGGNDAFKALLEDQKGEPKIPENNQKAQKQDSTNEPDKNAPGSESGQNQPQNTPEGTPNGETRKGDTTSDGMPDDIRKELEKSGLKQTDEAAEEGKKDKEEPGEDEEKPKDKPEAGKNKKPGSGGNGKPKGPGKSDAAGEDDNKDKPKPPDEDDKPEGGNDDGSDENKDPEKPPEETPDQREERIQKLLEKLAKEISEQTRGRMSNLANTTVVSEGYIKAVDEAIIATATGLSSHNEATKEVVKKVGEEGMTVTYSSGHKQSLESAARSNIVTACNQMAQQGSDLVAEETGCDCKEISVHSCPAPDHAPVQGHVLKNDQWKRMQEGEDFEDINGKEFKGFRRPIGQWNCMHFGMAFDSRYQEPKYTQEQLDQILEQNEKGFEWRGKHYTMYQGTQMMRALERKIRKEMMTAKAAAEAGNEELQAQCQKRIDDLGKVYDSLSKASGLRKKTNRIQVEGFKRYAGDKGPKRALKKEKGSDKEESRNISDRPDKQGLDSSEASKKTANKADGELSRELEAPKRNEKINKKPKTGSQYHRDDWKYEQDLDELLENICPNARHVETPTKDLYYSQDGNYLVVVDKAHAYHRIKKRDPETGEFRYVDPNLNFFDDENSEDFQRSTHIRTKKKKRE